MIKSDFGTIEVNGREPVIMAEFITLLAALRNALGEEKYNRALQRANDSVESKKDTETLKNEEKERMAEVIKAILVKWRISNYGRKQQFRGTESQHCGQPVD